MYINYVNNCQVLGYNCVVNIKDDEKISRLLDNFEIQIIYVLKKLHRTRIFTFLKESLFGITIMLKYPNMNENTYFIFSKLTKSYQY